MSIETNRDFYLALNEGLEAQAESQRSLEEYLRAILALGKSYQVYDPLPPDLFLEMLMLGFTAEPEPFKERWRENYVNSEEGDDFPKFLRCTRRQIVDLREMAEQGILDNEYRYFGIDAPRGERWYNFDPDTFLECATAGFIGGWQPDDDTGRELVPGEVLVIEEGEAVAKEPAELGDPIVILSPLTWGDVADFLYVGQIYE